MVCMFLDPKVLLQILKVITLRPVVGIIIEGSPDTSRLILSNT